MDGWRGWGRSGRGAVVVQVLEAEQQLGGEARHLGVAQRPLALLGGRGGRGGVERKCRVYTSELAKMSVPRSTRRASRRPSAPRVAAPWGRRRCRVKFRRDLSWMMWMECRRVEFRENFGGTSERSALQYAPTIRTTCGWSSARSTSTSVFISPTFMFALLSFFTATRSPLARATAARTLAKPPAPSGSARSYACRAIISTSSRWSHGVEGSRVT